jgi:hypothetical protein
MPDNWGFVGAAYGLAVLVLGGYWRFLRRRDRELDRLASAAARPGRAAAPPERPGAAARRDPAREAPVR